MGSENKLKLFVYYSKHHYKVLYYFLLSGKPNPPTIVFTPQSGKTVGENLVLRCETHSLSLPPSHNLPSVIEWSIDGGSLGDGANDDRVMKTAKHTEECIRNNSNSCLGSSSFGLIKLDSFNASIYLIKV